MLLPLSPEIFGAVPVICRPAVLKDDIVPLRSLVRELVRRVGELGVVELVLCRHNRHIRVLRYETQLGVLVFARDERYLVQLPAVQPLYGLYEVAVQIVSITVLVVVVEDDLKAADLVVAVVLAAVEPEREHMRSVLRERELL